MPLKAYIQKNMVGSKPLHNKWKTTPKIVLRTRQASAATPTTPVTKENNEELTKARKTL